jgi:hypothetical protein
MQIEEQSYSTMRAAPYSHTHDRQQDKAFRIHVTVNRTKYKSNHMTQGKELQTRRGASDKPIEKCKILEHGELNCKGSYRLCP